MLFFQPRNISVDDSLTDHVKDQMKSKVTKLEKSNTVCSSTSKLYWGRGRRVSRRWEKGEQLGHAAFDNFA